MRVVQLKAENIKRLTAVDITPGDGAVITIAGKNDQGKSSVLDAIAMALGGSKLAPKQPIKGDASRGEVTVDLGDYIVTRVFSRTRPACDCLRDAPIPMTIPDLDGVPPQAIQHQPTCSSLQKWGPVTSTLAVKSRDGAKFPSPQAMLDKLVGELTFDPLAFIELKPAEQDATLRRLAKLDMTELDAARARAFDKRTEQKRELSTRRAVLASYERFEAPAEEISIAALTAEAADAAKLRRVAEEAQRELDDAARAAMQAGRNIVAAEEERERLREALRRAEDQLDERLAEHAKAGQTLEALRNDAAVAAEAVPNEDDIHKRIAEADAINAKVRSNQTAANVARQVDRAAADVEALDKTIDDIDAAKAKHLAEAKFPIEGLGLSDDGPTYGGQLLAQASTAHKLRVSVAMGLALNPKLKVLLVHEGNDLDDDSMKLLAELAADAGAQVWLERIAGAKDGVSIVIEDGGVKA